MKKICVIMPSFFGYEQVIKEELINNKFEVTIIYENMDELNLMFRLVYVYFPSYKKKMMEKYYKHKFSKIRKNHFDYILVIRGESISKETMELLKKNYPDTKLIMYQWDSISNNPNALIIAQYFDRILTFDMNDSEKYKWIYRPLFYHKADFAKWNEKEYDVLFVCSIHSRRAEIYKQLKEITDKYHLKGYFRIYSKRSRYFKQKYIKKNPLFSNLDIKDVAFKSINLNEMNDLYEKSKVVVDYTHPNQKGFTMRTIESIGANCKLITNNSKIKNSDFYNANNIFVYEENLSGVYKDFWEKPYQSIDSTKFEYYSIHGWINDILNL